MSDSAGTVSTRDPNHNARVGDTFPFRHSYREPAPEIVLRRGRSRISNGQRFDPKKVKPGSSMARRYADIQAELIQAAGSDISPQRLAGPCAVYRRAASSRCRTAIKGRRSAGIEGASEIPPRRRRVAPRPRVPLAQRRPAYSVGSLRTDRDENRSRILPPRVSRPTPQVGNRETRSGTPGR
jgi:hypothetical protein